MVETGEGAEWPDVFLLSANTVESDWAEANRLEALYAAYDEAYLHVAVKGTVEGDTGPGNAIVVYVDVDPGAGTGFPAAGLLSDDNPAGSLDDAVSDTIVSAPDGFGADFAFGSVGMASHTLVQQLGDATHAGWRGLVGISAPDDLAWVNGEVLADRETAGIEARIPLATLFGGEPPAGARVAFIVRLGSATGEYHSNQGLPPVGDEGEPERPLEWVLFDLQVAP